MLQYSGLTLAYIGDAIFELKIREYLVNQGFTKVDDLHNKAIKYTSGKNQALFIDELINLLSQEEIDFFKKGRNAKTSHKPKNCDLGDYHKSTGFESLIGFLYLDKRYERLDEIIKLNIEYIEKFEKE